MKYMFGWIYAKNNGYTGSYSDYLSLQYQAYCDVCSQCKIDPMSKQEWEEMK